VYRSLSNELFAISRAWWRCHQSPLLYQVTIPTRRPPRDYVTMTRPSCRQNRRPTRPLVCGGAGVGSRVRAYDTRYLRPSGHSMRLLLWACANCEANIRTHHGRGKGKPSYPAAVVQPKPNPIAGQRAAVQSDLRHFRMGESNHNTVANEPWRVSGPDARGRPIKWGRRRGKGGEPIR
jgi:hypothetical protein